jgi:ABC-2 type transport system permease protein
MRPFLILLARRPAAVRNIIRNREGTKVAVMGAFAMIFALVMVGEYVVFLRTFSHLTRELGAGAPALTLYTLESFLVLVWLVTLLSFVVSGLWIFYRAADTPLLLATPLPLTTLYWLRVAETFILTSWAFVVLGIPALLALGVSYGSGAAYYVVALVVLVLFMAFTGGTGALLTALAGAAFRRFRSRTGILLTGGLLLGGFALLIGRHVVPSTADFTAIFEPGILNGKPGSIKFIEAKFAFWPSHPFAATLYVSATGQPAGTGTTRAALWFAPLLAVAAAALPGRWLYQHTLPLVSEGLALVASSKAAATGRGRFPRFLSGPVGCLVERDLLRLSRSPRELGQAALLLFLLALYIAFLFVAPLREASEKPETAARLLFLNLVATGYFLTAFGLRFVFPSFSLEGRTAWILFTSPVKLFDLFWGKLGLYTVLLFAVVGPIALAGTFRIGSSPRLLLAGGLLILLTTVTTVSVSLAFGAIWPNFREANPESLGTNAGGLATTFLCLGYVAAVGWAGYEAARSVLAGGPAFGYVGAAVGLSVVIVGGVLWAASRQIARLEVT